MVCFSADTYYSFPKLIRKINPRRSSDLALMRKPLTALTLIFLLLFLPALSIADQVKKNVLYLNSYHNGYKWSDGLLEGVRTVLNDSQFKVDLQIEYMDAKKFDYEIISKNLLALYKEKFKNESFDIIVISDNDALNFINQHRQELFPRSAGGVLRHQRSDGIRHCHRQYNRGRRSL